MTAELTVGSRVQHQASLRSYGHGEIVTIKGTLAYVMFDRESTQRLVMMRDLEPEAALALAPRVRPLRPRLVYSGDAG